MRAAAALFAVDVSQSPGPVQGLAPRVRPPRSRERSRAAVGTSSNHADASATPRASLRARGVAAGTARRPESCPNAARGCGDASVSSSIMPRRSPAAVVVNEVDLGLCDARRLVRPGGPRGYCLFWPKLCRRTRGAPRLRRCSWRASATPPRPERVVISSSALLQRVDARV